MRSTASLHRVTNGRAALRRPDCRQKVGRRKRRPGTTAAGSSRSLRQVLGQDTLSVGMAFGIKVDNDFRSGEAVLQLFFHCIHALMRGAHGPVAGDPNMELEEAMGTRSAGPKVVEA